MNYTYNLFNLFGSGVNASINSVDFQNAKNGWQFVGLWTEEWDAVYILEQNITIVLIIADNSDQCYIVAECKFFFAIIKNSIK